LETAAFALTSSSIFSVNNLVRIAVSGSSISTAVGLLCDAYLLLRFSFTSDSYVYQNPVTATDSYIFFSLTARLPLVLALTSIAFITALLGEVAYEISPPIALSVVGVAILVLSLRYIVWVLIWVVFGLLKSISVLTSVSLAIVAKIRNLRL
ncbi:hypothetical protein DFH09DRAFT_896507, partial [Mycena vulgaris]